MPTYLDTAPAASDRKVDISYLLWDVWELSAVKSWLITSHSKRQLLKRMEVAMRLFQDTLWWSMSLKFVPDQYLGVLDPESFNTEEFCWKGICPTPEAERQILEHAASLGRDYRDEPDVTPQQLRQRLMKIWTMREPVAAFNHYLLADHLLGEYGFEIRRG